MQNILKKLSEQEVSRFKQAIKSMMITSVWQGEIEPEVRKLEDRYDKLNKAYKNKTAPTGHNFVTDNGSDKLAGRIINISNDFTATVKALENFISDFDKFDNDGMELMADLDSDKNFEKAGTQLNHFEQMCQDIYQKHLKVKDLMEQTHQKIKKAEEILQQNIN